MSVVQFPPDRAKIDTSELQVYGALGQAHAIAQLLIAAHDAGHIRVATADDTLDKGTLSQALWTVEQELRRARKALDSFMASLAQDGAEVKP